MSTRRSELVVALLFVFIDRVGRDSDGLGLSFVFPDRVPSSGDRGFVSRGLLDSSVVDMFPFLVGRGCVRRFFGRLVLARLVLLGTLFGLLVPPVWVA